MDRDKYREVETEVGIDKYRKMDMEWYIYTERWT